MGVVTEPSQPASMNNAAHEPAENSSRSAHPDGRRARTQGMTTSERPTTAAGTPTPPGPPAWRPGVAASALVGVIAMGLAIGIAELLAAFGEWIGIFNTPASPLGSLGQTFIQFTPEWLKEFAIRTFGENDKTALTRRHGHHAVRGRHRHRHRRAEQAPAGGRRSPSC